MRILHITDIHGSMTAAEALPKIVLENEPDVLLVTGDITHFGPAEYVHDLLSRVEIRTLAIPGNCDPPEVLDAIRDAGALDIHRREVVVEGVTFFGLGGLVGPGVHAGVKMEESEVPSIEVPNKVDVLATHVPPYGILDEVAGLHVGSRAIFELSSRLRPKLHAFGHIHEARGVVQSGTIFVNPGPLRDGYFALEEPETSTVRLLSLR